MGQLTRPPPISGGFIPPNVGSKMEVINLDTIKRRIKHSMSLESRENVCICYVTMFHSNLQAQTFRVC